MKTIIFTLATTLITSFSIGQTDSTAVKSDTIDVGNMRIISNHKSDNSPTSDTLISKYDTTIIEDLALSFFKSKHNKPKRNKTSWLTIDLGFTNFADNTNYNNTGNFLRKTLPIDPNYSKSDFSLITGKSSNLNLWIFRRKQGINKIGTFNLIYGLMLEMNNYRFEKTLSTSFSPGADPYVFRSGDTYKKNKLALDYVTIPLMIGINTKPGAKGFTLGGGVNFGYLYSSRNKQVDVHDNKHLSKGNMNVNPFKMQYIGEIGLGVVKIYGSYSPKTIFKSDLEFRPYSFGIRFGEW